MTQPLAGLTEGVGVKEGAVQGNRSAASPVKDAVAAKVSVSEVSTSTSGTWKELALHFTPLPAWSVLGIQGDWGRGKK